MGYGKDSHASRSLILLRRRVFQSGARRRWRAPDLGSTMAAVATAPAGLGADDAARLLAPPPVEDVQFYSALTPRESLPLLAVSGVTGKAFWIGSLPQPPDEEEETDDESDGEESEEEHELDAEGAAVQVRTTPVSFGLHAHDGRAKNPRRPRSGPWLFFHPRADAVAANKRVSSLDDTRSRSPFTIPQSRITIRPPPLNRESRRRSSRSRSFARSAARRRRRCIACGRRRRIDG